MRAVFLNILLGHLLIAGFDFMQVPAKCGKAPKTQAEPCVGCCIYAPPNMTSNCTKVFQASINSTKLKVKEGDDITLTCVHNHPCLNLTFDWMRNKEDISEGRNKSKLQLKGVLSHKGGQYVCIVNSLCCRSESQPVNVTVENESMVVLIICGVSALALVLIMGLIMKYKLKRDSAKHRERRLQKELEQRTAMEQLGGPVSLTPRES